MDISSLKPSERIIDILHPVTREPLGITVSVLSLNDERVSKVRKKILTESQRLRERGKSLDADDIERNKDALMFATVTGWEWKDDAKFKGEKPVFNPKNLLAVMAELPWFRKQLEEAIEDEEAFFQT